MRFGESSKLRSGRKNCPNASRRRKSLIAAFGRSASRITGIALALLLAACSGKRDNEDGNGFPAGFASLPDEAMVEYVMKHVSADSVARFICNSALGRVPEGQIDTLAIAAAYAYEHYNDSCLLVFSKEFDDYSANLPLADKMKIYALAGEADPQRLGYQLGLEYVAQIREKGMTAKEVKLEVDAFRQACTNDTLMYERFMKGFRTALSVDHGKDLDEGIYLEFKD